MGGRRQAGDPGMLRPGHCISLHAQHQPRQAIFPRSIMPTDLIATITNASHNFAPYEQIIAQLHIQVPAFLVGTPAAIIERAVTVVGRLTGGELVGGATKLLRINN